MDSPIDHAETTNVTQLPEETTRSGEAHSRQPPNQEGDQRNTIVNPVVTLSLQSLSDRLDEQRQTNEAILAMLGAMTAKKTGATPEQEERPPPTPPARRGLFQEEPAQPENTDPLAIQRAETEALRNTIKEMGSQMHKATSAAPEIDRVLEETQQTPFTKEITDVRVRYDSKLRPPKYGKEMDPANFLTAFSIAVGRSPFESEQHDAGMCQLLAENLGEVGTEWFSRLKPRSISSYKQLSTAFLRQYSMYLKSDTPQTDLWTIKQERKEPLRKFMPRFKTLIGRMIVDDATAIGSLIHALWYESRFREDLVLHPTTSLDDAMHRATRYIISEEDRAALEKKYSALEKKYSATKAPAEREAVPRYMEPRKHIERKESPANQGRGSINNVNRQRSNQYIRKPDARDNQYPKGPKDAAPSASPQAKPYCAYHERTGHDTGDCYTLREHLYNQYLQGAGTSHDSGKTPMVGPSNVAPPKRDSSSQSNQGAQQPLKKIHMIMGGFRTERNSVRAIKKLDKKTYLGTQKPTEVLSDHPISFSISDAEGVSIPHNDPLVVKLVAENCEISRVLVDTGSSVNLIFLDTLKKMEVDLGRIKPDVQPLTGFDGETTMTVGTIKLAVHADGISRATKFVVVDKPATFNMIIGTPWLHAMRAVVSTYHQCLKFPTPAGVGEIRGSQRISRTCFASEPRMKSINLHIRAPDKEQVANPRSGNILKVSLDETNVGKYVGIGEGLSEDFKDKLVEFLRDNSSTFAWSTGDIKGIHPDVTSHELNVDPTYRPIKQKRRKLGPDRSQAVADEVQRLLKAGSIAEVKYPEWLANPVVVKKKNGKWRVCVDFTDLNKACPKDSFPLPNINQVVEATAGHELLSFMDAFSGYNQIAMHPDDREKTAFITDRGTYCYRVMPFGLKNAGATYQRLVNKMFADQIGETMEVYIDDMLVKSQTPEDHLAHLATCFAILNQYGMKLNPEKCTFAVTSGEFLGYIVTRRGIEANPKQISAVLELPSPRNVREVQRLTGRIAALNRFISRSTDKCLPFYQLLRANKSFQWDQRCDTAFQELKAYLTTPPILSKPEEGETLYLYISVSSAAVSGVLVREDRGEQKPIFYVSKSLIGAETRYPALEKLAFAIVMSARKLRPYFQSHSIAVLTSLPLRTVLHSPSQSGRMAKWAVELSEYDIDFRGRTAAKSQVLADFITEIPESPIPTSNGIDPTSEGIDPSSPKILPKPWILHVDGASSNQGSGVGIQVETPTGEVLEQSFRLNFKASNNEAEYEALIAGLRLAKGIGAKGIHAFCDSQLVEKQFNGEYQTKDTRMEAYLQLVKNLASEFEFFELTKIPRSENSNADALAALATTSNPKLTRIIPVEAIEAPSIELPQGICHITTHDEDDPNDDILEGNKTTPSPSEDWRDEIVNYIDSGKVPENKWAARRLKTRCAHYMIFEDDLYRSSATGVYYKCVAGADIYKVLAETHEGAGGNHSGGKALTLKVRKLGFYWPTLASDCEKFAARCEKCQRHGNNLVAPTELLTSSVAPYPFMRWAMDLIGPLPSSRKRKYILLVTDYFTKWVEAKAYIECHAEDVRTFIWKNIVCRHGLPYEIVTDNGTQFTSNVVENFCAVWKIRLSKSTPRNPTGNGQAEAVNKTILNGIKKRLETSKGAWADELHGVLWSYRTTQRRPTERSPFSLCYGMEAVSPAEVSVGSLRCAVMIKSPELNEDSLRNKIDELEEAREQALRRIEHYQRATAKYYNLNVRNRRFEEGDLVLRKVFENTAEYRAGKLGANWEGPYQVTKVVKPGVYELMTMEGDPTPRSWNARNLKRYYY